MFDLYCSCFPKPFKITPPLELCSTIIAYKCNDVALATSADSAFAVIHFYRTDSTGYHWKLLLASVTINKIIAVKDSPKPNLGIVECHLNACGDTIILLCLTHTHYSIRVLYLLSNLKSDYSIELGTMRSYLAVHPYQPMMCVAIPYLREEIKTLLVNYDDASKQVKQDIYRATLGMTDSKSFVNIKYNRSGTHVLITTVDSKEAKKISVYYVLVPGALTSRYLNSIHPTTTPPKVTLDTPTWGESCSTNFTPMLSKCHLEVAVPTVRNNRFELAVFKVAEAERLSEHCRVVIMKKLRHQSFVKDLPLPQRIKEFLWWGRV